MQNHRATETHIATVLQYITESITILNNWVDVVEKSQEKS
jgi:hypothetical protein